MHRRSSKQDDAQNALRVVEQALGAPLAPKKRGLRFPERKKNPAAVALGKLGGFKGGHATSAKLSPDERKAIAQRAAKARQTPVLPAGVSYFAESFWKPMVMVRRLSSSGGGGKVPSVGLPVYLEDKVWGVPTTVNHSHAVKEIMMTNPARHSVLIFGWGFWEAVFALALVCSLTMAVILPAHAQTLTVLHNFTSGGDGDFPNAGLTMDSAGNFYSTTSGGGYASLNCGNGCGTVFKLSRNASSWVLTPVYSFTGGDDGTAPEARVLFGPDGLLYGTTTGDSSLGATGKATAFRLRLPATPCKTALCPGEETVLYRFTGPMDGSGPGWGDLAFDQAGNLYGTTSDGGAYGAGSVYELTPSGGSWTETILYSFTGGEDGSQPKSGVTFDQAGNLYGTTLFGGTGARGTVFQLTHSGSGWTEKVLHSFGSSGSGPYGGLIFDPSGNLYGTTQTGYMGQGNGTVFMLTPSGDDWTLTTLYSFPVGFTYPYARLTMDAAGNLYGTTSYYAEGYFGSQGSEGSVFKLAFLNGSWTYVDLHDFDGRSDGAGPFGSVTLDADGNLYGTGTAGGTVLYCSGGCGVVWEIAP